MSQKPFDMLPFPGCTGSGVRVAVIDSGVNPRHPHIGNLAGGVCIGANARVEKDSYLDLLGHGTAVMAAIQEKAPDAEYFAVKLFHSALRTSVDCLVKAIEWTIENRMDVVNLSLGTSKPDHKTRLTELAACALENGVTLVSAQETDGQRCFPGCLPSVLGVRLDWDCDRDTFRCEETSEGLRLHASGYPRSLPGMTRERNLHGISFAVANMSGFIIRACESLTHETPETLGKVLLAEAARVNSLVAR